MSHGETKAPVDELFETKGRVFVIAGSERVFKLQLQLQFQRQLRLRDERRPGLRAASRATDENRTPRA